MYPLPLRIHQTGTIKSQILCFGLLYPLLLLLEILGVLGGHRKPHTGLGKTGNIKLQILCFGLSPPLLLLYTPQPLKCIFTHGVRMGGRAGGGKKFVRAVSQKP